MYAIMRSAWCRQYRPITIRVPTCKKRLADSTMNGVVARFRARSFPGVGRGLRRAATLRPRLRLFLVRIAVHEVALFTGLVQGVAGFEQRVGALLVDRCDGLHRDIVEFGYV